MLHKTNMLDLKPQDVSTDTKKGALEKLGCEHYTRGAMVKAECCGEFVWCQFCHDENKSKSKSKNKVCDQEMDRYAVREMRCVYCGLEQLVGQDCAGCGMRVGQYYCEDCKFLDDDTSKGLFHCDLCRLCRKGGRENFYHCTGCSACLAVGARGQHHCVDMSLHSNCPVCMEFLFTSTQAMVILRCGHPIHARCANDLVEFSSRKNEAPPKCPTCHRSIVESKFYSDEMDQIMAQQPMPAEYKNKKSAVFCNDCQKRSNVPYHFVYHKCECCGSYNTVVL